MLYEEGLDDATVRAAVRQLQQAELLIVAGTSLTVYPADLVLHERVGEVCRHLRPTPLEVGE